MPNLRELVESTGAKIDDWFYNPSNPQYDANQKLLADATSALYGNVGANLDTRNWDQIMASDNTIQAANDALAAMYSDPAYREQNAVNLSEQGYQPAQAYYTYGQMNDRVGASYTPSPTEVAAVEKYFKDQGTPNYVWQVPKPSASRSTANAITAGSAGGGATTQTSGAGGLTPQLAAELMQRSMTTGVPTSEFDKYGGYNAVKALYDSNKGTYSLNELDPAFLARMDDIIANTGVGNLSVLKMTGQPLTNAGYQAMLNNGVSMTEADLKAAGIPYEGFLQVPKKTTATQPGTAGNAGQPTDGARVMGPLPGATADGGFNTWRAGAAGNDMLGAGNADYHSELLKALRQSSINPISNNQGVQFLQNRGSSTSNWTPPTADGNSAFNPQVLNPRAASPQEVSDWNAYSTYRTNALNSKTPIVSFSEWLAKGKSTGNPADPNSTPTLPPVDYSGGGG